MKLTAVSRAPLEKLIVDQLIKGFLASYGSQNFIIHSQEHATVLHSKLEECSPQRHTLLV